MGGDDRRDDGQAQPGASGVAGARVVETVEALEHLLGAGGVDARAVIAHLHHHPVARAIQDELHRRALGRVAHHVAQDVGQHLAQRVLVAGHRTCPRPGLGDELGRPGGVERTQVGQRILEQGVQLDPFTSDRATFVEARQLEQVGDQLAHPAGLGLHPGHRCRQLVLGDRAHSVELAVPANGGQRGAQLVAGVGDEAAHLALGGRLHREGVLDLGEHDVEGVRQTAHLRARTSRRDPPGQVTGGDGPRGHLDLAQGPQRPAHRHPAGEGPGDDDGHPADDDRRRDLGDRAVDAGERQGHGQGAGLRRGAWAGRHPVGHRAPALSGLVAAHRVPLAVLGDLLGQVWAPELLHRPAHRHVQGRAALPAQPQEVVAGHPGVGLAPGAQSPQGVGVEVSGGGGDLLVGLGEQVAAQQGRGGGARDRQPQAQEDDEEHHEAGPQRNRAPLLAHQGSRSR